MPREGFSRKRQNARALIADAAPWHCEGGLNVGRSPVIPHDKLFTPGPVEVSEKTLAAFSRPMIGHRGEDFKALYRAIHPRLQELFGTRQPVFLSTSSAWGVMEGAIRNLVRQRVLCCMCGAFSDKWLDVARRCGKEAEPLQVGVGAGDRPQGARCPARDRKVRHRHPHPQRDFDRGDEPAPGDLLHDGEISGGGADRRFRLLLLRRPDPNGRIPDRCPPHRLAKGARASARFCAFQRFRESLRARGPGERSRLLLRFPRIQETAGRRHDSDDPEHWTHLRSGIEAGGDFRRRPDKSLCTSRPYQRARG